VTAPITTRRRDAGQLQVRLLAAWLLLHTATRSGLLDRTACAWRRRWHRINDGGERGLATVEVAILAAVLLGLATALLAAILAVVNKHVSQIK
jgi:hypothetical protein